LRHAEIDLAALDGVHVEHRAARRFDRAAQAVILAVLVDQTANRAARGVVHPGDTASADRDEFLLRLRRRTAERKGADRSRGREGKGHTT
jgi:hypothetical protein